MDVTVGILLRSGGAGLATGFVGTGFGGAGLGGAGGEGLDGGAGCVGINVSIVNGA
jgi:hypothetical protein